MLSFKVDNIFLSSNNLLWYKEKGVVLTWPTSAQLSIDG